VGTLFSVVIDSTEAIKRYIVKCGDAAEPCALDIEIQYAIRESMSSNIEEGMSNIEQLKWNIIREKNNAIFFGRNVESAFEQLTEELKTETENTGFMVETNYLRNDNPEKKAMLKRLEKEFGKSYLAAYKTYVNQFEETNDTSHLKHAVELYHREMAPKLKEIRELKYNINSVEYDADTNAFHLRQYLHSLESNEFYFKKDDKLVKLMRDKEKKPPKTKTLRVQKPLKKNKTIKLVQAEEAEAVVEEETDTSE
jgi:hypothetical protein